MFIDFLEERERRMEVRQSRKFKSTNAIWNELGLNLAWSIGYMTKLFKEFGGKDYVDWLLFYEETGNQRLKKIMELPLHKQELLMDFTVHANKNMKKLHILSFDEKNLNAYYGRTIGELDEIAYFMYVSICQKGNPFSLTEEDCRDFVYIRVLDEIFIGVEREMNTLITLEKMFPTLSFKEVDIQTDTTYAVDFEVYQGDQLLMALQVKSSHYKIDNQSSLLKTKAFNHRKHENYARRHGVGVSYIYSDIHGTIEDHEVLEKLQLYV